MTDIIFNLHRNILMGPVKGLLSFFWSGSLFLYQHVQSYCEPIPIVRSSESRRPEHEASHTPLPMPSLIETAGLPPLHQDAFPFQCLLTGTVAPSQVHYSESHGLNFFNFCLFPYNEVAGKSTYVTRCALLESVLLVFLVDPPVIASLYKRHPSR